MPPALLDSLHAQTCRGAELLIVESAMGLFDGVRRAARAHGAARPIWRRGSGWGCCWCWTCPARRRPRRRWRTGWPASTRRCGSGGVVLNRVGSEKHRRAVTAAMRVPVLGAIPRDGTLALPERHLGLVQAGEHPALAAQLDRLADMAERYLDLDAILKAGAVCRSFAARGRGAEISRHLGSASPWRRMRPSPSPIRMCLLAGARLGPRCCRSHRWPTRAPPEDADTCWLPGGYPELHAPALSAAGRFRAGLRRFAGTRPVHG